MVPFAVRVLLFVALTPWLVAQGWNRTLLQGPAGNVAAAVDPATGTVCTAWHELVDGRWRPRPAPRLQWNYCLLAADVSRATLVLLGTPPGGVIDTFEYRAGVWTRRGIATPNADSNSMAWLLYDGARQRVVLLRTTGYGQAPVEVHEYDGQAWSLRPVATPPLAYADAAATYDPLHARLVLLGTSPLTLANRTFVLDATATAWTELPAAVPPYRAGGSFVSDDARGRLLLFGGVGSGGLLRDTWEFDGAIWRQLWPQHAPPARMAAAMVFDPHRQQPLLLAGRNDHGNSGYSPLCDAWTFDGSDWQMVLGPGPWQPWGATGYDPARQRLVYLDQGLFTAEPTWEWDGVAWRSVATWNQPLMAFGSLAYARADRALVLHPWNATWTYDGTDWTQRAPAHAPSARGGHVLAADPQRGGVVLHGGNDGTTDLQDTWEYRNGDWTFLATAHAPAPMAHACMAADTARGVMVLHTSPAKLSQTWCFDGRDWTPIPTAHVPPPRILAQMVHDPVRGRMVLAGGESPSWVALDDTWTFDGTDWQPMPLTDALLPTYGHGMVYDSGRDRVVAYGGGGSNYYGDYRSLQELTPAPVASFARHGTGCAGPAGTPSLDRLGTTLPHLGSTFVLQLSALPATPTPVLLLAGSGIAQWNGVALPIELGGPDCLLWIEPQAGAATFLLAQGGAASIALPLPNLPWLADAHLALQAVALDPQAPNGLGACSNACILVLR